MAKRVEWLRWRAPGSGLRGRQALECVVARSTRNIIALEETDVPTLLCPRDSVGGRADACRRADGHHARAGGRWGRVFGRARRGAGHWPLQAAGRQLRVGREGWRAEPVRADGRGPLQERGEGFVRV